MSMTDPAPGCKPGGKATAPVRPGKAAQIESVLRVLSAPGAGDVREVRVFNYPESATFKTTHCGFYDNLPKMACDILVLNLRRVRNAVAPGVYVTINPVKKALLGRSANRERKFDKGEGTKDEDIECREWVVFDIDPKRPSGINATDEERQAAREAMEAIATWLTATGWPEPIKADSGNGFYLLYRVALPNDEPARLLVKACLEAVANRFDSPSVSVDKTVFNASRVIKALWTVARKGDEVEGRLWHRSEPLSIPGVEDLTNVPPDARDRIGIVTREQLEALAATIAKPARTTTTTTRAAAKPSTVTPAATRSATANRTQAYTEKAMTDELAKIQAAQPGERNAILNSSSFALFTLAGGGHLDVETVRAECERAGLAAGLPEDEAKKTVESARAAGLAKPRSIPDPPPGPADAPHPVAAGGGASVCGVVREEPDDPYRLAWSFLEAEATKNTRGDCLVYWQQQYWGWHDSRYATASDAMIAAKVTAHTKTTFDCDAQIEADRLTAEAMEKHAQKVQEATARGKTPPAPPPPAIVPPMKVSAKLLTDTLGAIRADRLKPDEIGMPTWLGADPGRRNWLATEAGILDLDNLSAPPMPPTPLWFSAVALPYKFDPAATCPRWEAFLMRSLADPAKVRLFRQWCGYLVSGRLDLQKFLVLAGEGGTGKSSAIAGVRALLGDDNVSAVPIERFGGTFDLSGTVGKLVNIPSDVGDIEKLDEGVLKAYTSGDLMRGERKYKPAFWFIPTARLMFGTNAVPSFNDKSAGIWRRLLILPFDAVVTEGEKVLGMDRVGFWHGERAGMLNWAIAGLADLQREGCFTIPEACRDAVEDHRLNSNPTLRFLREEVQAGEGMEEEVGVLYDAYRKWCDENGYRYKLTNAAFGKELLRCFPGVTKSRPRPEGRRRPWVYVGVYLVQDPNKGEALATYRPRPRAYEP